MKARGNISLIFPAMLVSLFVCTFSTLNAQITLKPFWKNQFGYSGWDSLAGGIGPLRDCYDALYYNLEVAIDPTDKSLIGYCEMTFRAVRDFDRMQVDLNRHLKVSEVRLNQKHIEFVRKNDLIYLLPGDIKQNETHILAISYEGKPPVSRNPPWKGGFVWAKDPNGNPWISAVCEDKSSSLWWPNKAHPSDEPDSMRISLIIPDGLEAISNGTLIQTGPAIPGTHSAWVWKIENPINADNVCFYIGKFDHFQIPIPASKTTLKQVDCYMLPADVAKAKTHFQQVNRIITFMEKHFGPYPFAQDGFKIVQSPYVGMEHQSAIAYGSDFSNEGRYFTHNTFDYILLHETAHQWWGNSLTACDVAETWLHEGFATYSEALYLEEFMGKHHYQSYLNYIRSGIEGKYPLIGPRGVNFHSPWNSDIYGKGAWVLHSFRSALGDDLLFAQILKDWATKNSKSIVCTEDFTQMIELETGENWDPFFTQYLYQTQNPLLEYYLEKDHLYFRWNEVNEGFKMPIRIIGKDYGIQQPCTQRISKIEVPGMTDPAPEMDFALFRTIENPLLPLLAELE